MKLTQIISSISSLALLSPRLALADIGDPTPAQSRTIETNWANYFKDRSITPPDMGVKSLLQSPSPSTNFLGLDGWGFNPDTDGAVGRGDFVMALLNTGASVQTRAGILLETNSLSGFW